MNKFILISAMLAITIVLFGCSEPSDPIMPGSDGSDSGDVNTQQRSLPRVSLGDDYVACSSSIRLAVVGSVDALSIDDGDKCKFSLTLLKWNKCITEEWEADFNDNKIELHGKNYWEGEYEELPQDVR